MPRLIGQTFADARQDATVTKLNLQLDAVRRQTRDQRPGVIIEQDPPPGSPIKPGIRVTVYVAVPPPTDRLPDDSRNQGERGQPGRAQPDVPRMPNLLGQPFDSAQRDRQVVDLKLRLIPRDRITDDRRPGTIVDHEPRPGSPVKPGAPVAVFVAVPPPPPPPPILRMPNLVGQPFQSAQEDSRVVRLKLQLVPQSQPTANERPGVIVRHEPPAETPVKPGTPVTVIVAVPIQQPPPPPPPLPRMPDLAGQLFQAAQQDGRVLRLDLKLVPQPQATANERPGVILRHDPPADSPIRPGTPVTVIVAVAPPPAVYPMPDLIGRAFPAAERDATVLRLRLQLNQQVDSRAAGPPNTIVRQSVPAGANVQVGDAVTVFVASGVAVPRVLQQQADAAAQRIVEVGLTPQRSNETSEQTPGTVLRQVPEPGVLVARGGAVAITVAIPRKVIIPNVVGRTRADAVQELNRLQLRAAPVDDPGSRLPPQQVVAQVPAAGTEVVVGGAVQIAVATGIQVPDLSGMSAADAQQSVAQLGLSFEDREAENDTVPANRVFEQQPAAGSAVARGSAVRVTVAIPVPVPVPDVTGATRAEAERRLRGVRLTAVVVEVASLIGPDRVDSQSPAAGATVRPGTAVTLRVAVGLVPPPPQPLPPPLQDSQPAPAPVLPDPQRTVPVPDLSGRARQEAEQMLIRVGLVARLTEADSANPPNTVVGQDPAANTQVSLATAVNVVVARPSAPITPTGGVAVVPPWLTVLVVLIATVGISTWKLWRPPWGRPSPRVVAQSPAPPPPALVEVEPHPGAWTQRLETTGRSLVEWDMRVRVWRGTPDHAVEHDGTDLIAEERRLYE